MQKSYQANARANREEIERQWDAASANEQFGASGALPRWKVPAK